MHQPNLDTKRSSWSRLNQYAERDAHCTIKSLFDQDEQRFSRYSLQVNDMLLDYSKNLLGDDTREALFELAREADIEGWREKMFSGARINRTEDRPVLHVALRNQDPEQVMSVDGVNIHQLVEAELASMKEFVAQVRSGQWTGFSGKPIKDVVNIGIGGSNLGPQMVTEALSAYSDGKINVHYVSNVDSLQIAQVLRRLNPEEVLFVVSSKTFTTRETLTNAKTAQNWLLASSFDEAALSKHFVAVTANRENARKFGFEEDNIFNLWSWVGGRFSLWSAIGLPIALNLGFDQFQALLEGAHSMDKHFCDAPLEQNAPVILALVGIWNSTFMGAQAQAVLPYNQSLHMFSAYLQQAEMESNGKSVDWDGKELGYHTGSIIWGQLGINGQHAFYQYLHQGTNIVPADFIAGIESATTAKGHHEYLMANLFAQTQALMNGIDEQQIREELEAKGKDRSYIDQLVSHKVHKGNRPTNTLLMQRVDARSLGALIALYEHKIFVQGVIWRVCSFDQWGVELGKELASHILLELEGGKVAKHHDSSTKGLIEFYQHSKSVSL